MTVYVDNMRANFGRMIMCHMISDSEDELHAMADRIGVARKWYQGDHYDIALSKRHRAIAAGAVEITWREAGLMAGARRRGGRFLTLDEAWELLRRSATRSAATRALGNTLIPQIPELIGRAIMEQSNG